MTGLVKFKYKMEEVLANKYTIVYTSKKDPELKEKTDNALRVLAHWKDYTPSYVLYSIRFLVTQRKLEANKLGVTAPIKCEIYILNKKIEDYERRLRRLPYEDQERQVIEINIRKWSNMIDWYTYILDYIQLGEVVMYRLA